MHQLMLELHKCQSIYVGMYYGFRRMACAGGQGLTGYLCGITGHCFRGNRCIQTDAKSSINVEEIERFQQLSTDWLMEESSFKALYSMNKLRVPWIVKGLSATGCRHGEYPLRGRRIVDVGCGGGILSAALARLGASVSAIDASAEAVRNTNQVVNLLLKRNTVGSVTVHHISIEDYAKQNPESFHGVVASEVVEHVDNIDSFMQSCIALGRRDAAIFVTTINKTLLSRIFAVYFAEEIFRIVQSGIHDWSKFVQPSKLREIFEANGCDVCLTHGLTYNPFTNIWTWCRSPAVNYAMMARKL